MADDAGTRRILLVAQGTLDRPLQNILWMVGGISLLLLCGFAIVRSGLPTLPTIVALVCLVVVVAFIQGRFGGPREFRVEKPHGGGPLQLTGRFADGEIRSRDPLPLERVELDNGALAFEVRRDQTLTRYHLHPPAFSPTSLEALRKAITDLESASETDIHSLIAVTNETGIKFYDARSLILLRFSQKPAFTTFMWLVCGLTVLGWLMAVSLLGA